MLLNSFLLSLNAIISIFAVMAVGYGAKRLLHLEKEYVGRFNSLVFYTLLPLMLFYNIYRSNIRGGVSFQSGSRRPEKFANTPITEAIISGFFAMPSRIWRTSICFRLKVSSVITARALKHGTTIASTKPNEDLLENEAESTNPMPDERRS